MGEKSMIVTSLFDLGLIVRERKGKVKKKMVASKSGYSKSSPPSRRKGSILN